MMNAKIIIEVQLPLDKKRVEFTDNKKSITFLKKLRKDHVNCGSVKITITHEENS